MSGGVVYKSEECALSPGHIEARCDEDIYRLIAYLSGCRRTVDKGSAQGLEAQEMVGVHMTEEASKRSFVIRLMSEVIDSNLGKF